MAAERLNNNSPELQVDNLSTLSDNEVPLVDFASVMESTNPETIPQKERMTKEYINKHFYVNWTSAENLKNSKVEKVTENVYSVEFDHEFKEWEKKMKIIFETKYDKNSGFMTFSGYKISADWEWWDKHSLNTTFEIDPTTHNQYDVRTAWNWKRENFSIVYNEQKTKDYIKDIVRKKDIIPKKEFETIDDLENTQLTKLNNPKLWDEVYDDGEGSYYRTLYYTTWSKIVNITNIYFTPTWEYDTEKNPKEWTIKVMETDIKYSISKDLEFSLDDWSKQELIERVRHDRSLLINMLNKTTIADPEVFSWLEKEEKNGAFQFDTHIIYLDPIAGPWMSWLYSIKLNKNKNLDPLYCKVQWDNVSLTDETGKSTDTVYINYEDKNNKKATNYYKVTKGSDRLNIIKLKNKYENPVDVLPNYSGDLSAIYLLNKSGNLTHYENSSLEYVDGNWNLVSKMPCHRLEDLSYEVNEEYSTKIEPQKLYNYTWFKDKTLKKEIENLTKELWIVDAYKLEIFEKCLKDKGVEFTQKLIEITNTNEKIETGRIELKDPITQKKEQIKTECYESRYYKLSDSFEINLDKGLYDKVEDCLKLMKSRLKLAKQINNSHVKRKNGKIYKDFESFIWWETWVWKHIIAPDELKKFISWETNEVTVRISRWMWKSWENVDILYKANWDYKSANQENLRTWLKSWEERWKAFLDPQRYSIYAINKENKKDDLHPGDVVFDPIEERE